MGRIGAAGVGLALLVATVAFVAAARGERFADDPGRIVFVRNGGAVYSVKADGSGPRRMNVPGYPVWSRNLKQMAFYGRFADDTRLFIANGDGSRRRQLVRLRQRQTCGSFAPAAVGKTIAWSPDGKRIAFTAGCDVDFTSIFVIRRDGSGIRRLVRGDWHLGPRWSPDGRRILFVSNPAPHKSGWWLYLVNPNGHMLRRVARTEPDGFSEWVWSRDGKQILLLTERKLFVVDRRNGRRRQLAPQLTDIRTFALSPDGQRIALTASGGLRQEVFVIRLDGSDLQQLTSNRVRDGDPQWSPDGRRIAFSSERDGNSEIYVMGADGSNLTNVTRDPGRDDAPTWVRRR